MKLKGLFAIMAAALLLSMSFTSCEGLDGLFDDENESNIFLQVVNLNQDLNKIIVYA